MTAAKSDKVLADYRAARKAAGTIGDGDAAWNYTNGWYRIGYGSYRKAKVLEMTERLWRMANEKHGTAT